MVHNTAAPDRLHTCHLSDGGAMLGGRVQVDVVGPDTRCQDKLQFGRLTEQLLCIRRRCQTFDMGYVYRVQLVGAMSQECGR